MLVLGSLKLDVVVQLSPAIDLQLDSAYHVVPISYRLGGTAGTFLTAASPVFGGVSVIAALGHDQLGRSILAYLAELNVTSALEYNSVANGVVVSLRVGDHSTGRRTMLASEASPHRALSATHVTANRELIEGADAMVCDTYFLTAHQSSAALLAALKIASNAGVQAVLDLVPHSMALSWTWGDLQPYVGLASTVVAEARTIVSLTEQHWPIPEMSTNDLVRRALKYARAQSNATWLIRYGFANIGSVSRLDPDGTTTEYSTLLTRSPDHWGLGDRLLVSSQPPRHRLPRRSSYRRQHIVYRGEIVVVGCCRCCA